MELKKIKLNKLSNNALAERQMKGLKGGCRFCTCSCAYAGHGGSNAQDNKSANFAIGSEGGRSKTGDNFYYQVDPCGDGCFDNMCY